MYIPTFEEAQQAESEMKLTPLQKFILDNEPAGLYESTLFRVQLREAIDFVISEYQKDVNEHLESPDSNL